MAKKPTEAVPDWVGEESNTAVAVLDKPEPGGELTTQISEDMFLEDAGTNNFGKEDIAIPFLKVLQDLSPQTKPRDPKYVEGAAAGMFFNSVTNQIWEGEKHGIIGIPVFFTPSYTEWKPNRGGFVKDHLDNAAIMDQTKKGGKDGKEDVLPNGNVIQRAGMYYMFLYDEVTGDTTEMVFSLASTGLAVSRKWNSQIRSVKIKTSKGLSVNPAMFYLSYRIKTFLDKREAGEFFNLQITPYKPTVELGPTGGMIYLKAREFVKMITSGTVTVKHEQEEKSDANEAF